MTKINIHIRSVSGKERLKRNSLTKKDWNIITKSELSTILDGLQKIIKY